MREKALTYVVALATFCGVFTPVGPVSATPGIVFDYQEVAGFVLGTAVVVESEFPPASGGVEFFGAVNDPTLGTIYSTIGWGCTFLGAPDCAADGNNVVGVDPLTNNSRSALNLVGLTGQVVSDGDWVTISEFTHKNQVITGNHLDTVAISAVLRLSSVPPLEDADVTTINFEETVNFTPCASPNPVGTVCDDFWSFDPTGVLADVPFEHNGEIFLAQFRLGEITNAVFDPATGRIYTAEGQRSNLTLEMRVVQQAPPCCEVPEPVSVTLLGAGLIGIGFFTAVHRAEAP